MTKPLVIALLMSGCVFGAATDTVGTGNALVRINEVRVETDAGMQTVRGATFIPDFETGSNDLTFDGEGWSGTMTLRDLASTIGRGGAESLLIERGGSAEIQPIRIASEVVPVFGDSGFDRRATLTFVVYIENRSVQVIVELDLAPGYDC